MVFQTTAGTAETLAVKSRKYYRTKSTRSQSRQSVIFLALTLLLQSQCLGSQAALAAAEDSTDSTPTGTLLIPLTPKLDTSPAKAKPRSANSAVANSDSNSDVATSTSEAKGAAGDSTPTSKPADDTTATDQTSADSSKTAADDGKKKSPGELAMEKIEKGDIQDDVGDAGAEDTTLKGTVQIVADDTEYDQAHNTFLGSGNAVALIGGQDSKLEADTILYNQDSQIMDARGHVRILRNGNLTTGDTFKFKVTSDEYLITSPDTEVSGSQVIARKAIGTNKGVTFKDGNLIMPDPFYMQRNAIFGPLAYREMVTEKMVHPDAYLPSKQTFKFKAKKMVYERYKTQGNLTVFGGRFEFGSFSIPVPKFTMTAGKASKVTMPTTFLLGSNLQNGGTNIGPRFNTQILQSGVLSWAPLVQIGGTSINGANNSGIGLGGQVAFTNDLVATHLGYGSVSNLLVGDLKFNIYGRIKFQSGINRFLPDGMLGIDRARLKAEIVDNHSITTIPYLQSLNFFSAAGWMQDNPQLLNLSPQYKALFGTSANRTTITSGWRIQEHVTAVSHPFMSVGNNQYGMKGYVYGGVAARGYSTGNADMIGQIGPVMDIYLDKLRLQTGYTQSAVRGSSPFVFDEYIQGTQYAYASGSYKINKYVMIGGTLGYNLQNDLPYQKTVNIAVGPEDFKIIGAYDTIYNLNRIGFDVLYGQPAGFNRLVMKGGPDQGQQGGI